MFMKFTLCKPGFKPHIKKLGVEVCANKPSAGEAGRFLGLADHHRRLGKFQATVSNSKVDTA